MKPVAYIPANSVSISFAEIFLFPQPKCVWVDLDYDYAEFQSPLRRFFYFHKTVFQR